MFEFRFYRKEKELKAVFKNKEVFLGKGKNIEGIWKEIFSREGLPKNIIEPRKEYISIYTQEIKFRENYLWHLTKERNQKEIKLSLFHPSLELDFPVLEIPCTIEIHQGNKPQGILILPEKSTSISISMNIIYIKKKDKTIIIELV